MTFSSVELVPLVRRSQSGDAEAFTQLVRSTQSELRTHLGAIGCRAELRDDVIQTAYITAFERLYQCRDPATFLAWLKTIARHQLSRELTARRRHASLSGDALAQLEARGLEEGLNRADESADQLTRLRQCLEKLAPQSRRMIAARYERGQDPDTIAAELERSAVWVRVNLFRIRDWLRRCVETRP